jgi:HTH-type transcriptional regulator/antitoxin HigA
MDIKPIRTEADYKAALSTASAFFNQQPAIGTPEGDHFEILLMLIDAYEQKRYPIVAPDPIEAIKLRMEQSGLTAKDLQPMIGRLNRVYEVLINDDSGVANPAGTNLDNLHWFGGDGVMV